MQGARWWLVCYDVRDPERLRRTAKHLEGYGERMQYSVFRCWLTPREAERLRWELTELVAAEDDVMVIPVCPTCAAGIRGTHSAERPVRWPAEPERHLII
ncbi:MAG TPA: CRISPR-associated endonuclease Cas2 [Gemmataceae bacterium]|jgi:CRISPR-associated protein Cas2